MKPVALCLILLLPLAGCRGGKKTPRPIPSPFAFQAQVARFEAVIPDGKGGRLALVRGASGKIGRPSWSLSSHACATPMFTS